MGEEISGEEISGEKNAGLEIIGNLPKIYLVKLARDLTRPIFPKM